MRTNRQVTIIIIPSKSHIGNIEEIYKWMRQHCKYSVTFEQQTKIANILCFHVLTVTRWDRFSGHYIDVCVICIYNSGFCLLLILLDDLSANNNLYSEIVGLVKQLNIMGKKYFVETIVRLRKIWHISIEIVEFSNLDK